MERPELEDTAEAPPRPASDPSDRTATAIGSTPRLPSAGGIPTGKQLGHFRIERLLGAGGMGEVYLATDLALDRPVAIKVLPEELARDPRRRDRMIREARAQARVGHPNVGHMYFIGEDVDRLYFAMEYVAGRTLADRIASGPMSVNDALAVVRAAALGLREAQRNGFTHRDVKPSNLMIDSHGILKVLDFGLAAGSAVPHDSLPPSSEPREHVPAVPVTQTSFAGTPLYMAPEQARGEAVDFRADIYALGATLYHLVSGKPPFQADSVDELLSLHATAARPSMPRRGQPRTQIGAIDALCTKMMAARPEDRYASYDDLLRAVELASLSHTRPAGFWARGVAQFLDFAIVGFVLVLLELAADAIGGVELESSGPVLLPMLALYQAVTTARWGRSPGKAVIELEVVDVNTADRPSFARALRRSLALYGPLIVLTWVSVGFTVAGIEPGVEFPILKIVLAVAFTVFLVGGVIALLYASARGSGKRAVWDRVAGTMVRYRTTRAASM